MLSVPKAEVDRVAGVLTVDLPGPFGLEVAGTEMAVV
jgi:hypothetical protein